MNRPSRFHRPWWATALVAGCALVASAAFAGTDTHAAPTATAKKPAKPRWVEAASKHGGSGIKLRYSVAETLQPGAPAEVRVQFSGVDNDDARVELRAPQSATLTDAAGNAVTSLALPRGTTTLLLRLTPVADGMQTLDVFTSQGQRTSAQSVPLKVGSGKLDLQKMGKAQTTPSGEKVISLPAEPR